MNSPTSNYFGCSAECLDILTLRYRWFGAIWIWKDNLQLILGYWFADSHEELLKQVKQEGWTDYIKIEDKNEIIKIYNDIHREQKRQNWEQRSRLSFQSIWKKPWKELLSGWYVIRSRKEFPLIATCIQKKRFTVWIEHVWVCEQSKDLNEFFNLINQKHKIKLKML